MFKILCKLGALGISVLAIYICYLVVKHTLSNPMVPRLNMLIEGGLVILTALILGVFAAILWAME